MKKKFLRVCLMLVILCGGILLTNGSVQAKTQNYYTKGKTLVVTGQLRNGTHIKNAKKIKKIVVKDNIKILPTKPFKGCINVKTLEVPGKLIFVDDFLGEVYDNDNYENFPITVKTVKFTTQLSDKPMYKFYLTHKFIVSKKDKKYRSYKGSIYTKNGKKFVAMPSECKILKIRKGCKIVNVVGFSYESYNEESCSDDPDYYILTCCKKLKKVIIPSTVKSYYTSDSNFKDYMREAINDVAYRAKYVIKNKNISCEGMEALYEVLEDRIFKIFKKQIKKQGDFYIYNNNILVGYDGCQLVVTIPKGIKYAMKNSLSVMKESSYNIIRAVKLPKGFKDKKSKIWRGHSYYSEWYNQDKIVLSNYYHSVPSSHGVGYKYNTFCTFEYCKHYYGKTIQIISDIDGIIIFSTDVPVRVTDKNNNIVERDLDGSYTVYVNKGDAINVQLPDKVKDDEFIYLKDFNGIEN